MKKGNVNKKSLNEGVLDDILAEQVYLRPQTFALFLC